MNKKYLKVKINQYIRTKKDNPNFIEEWNDEILSNFLEEWLLTKRKTKQMIEILSYDKTTISNIICEIILEKKKMILKKRIEEELQNKLEKLFTEMEDKHVGTSLLNGFYKNNNIDYSLARERANHAGQD